MCLTSKAGVLTSRHFAAPAQTNKTDGWEQPRECSRSINILMSLLRKANTS
uniref:Uncharacterized protein n=1 Tax=Anguilla anguilla TaxID=7936 RepID=A0A0E9PTR9_ANGAN